MTYDEVLIYCGDEFGNVSGYKIAKKLGVSMTTAINWKKWGFVPIKAQMLIEAKTGGALRADLNHCGRHDAE